MGGGSPGRDGTGDGTKGDSLLLFYFICLCTISIVRVSMFYSY